MYLCRKITNVLLFLFLIKAVKTSKRAIQAGLGPDKLTVVVGCVSFAILTIVIIVAVILYKRKKAYGSFYIFTLPPLPDYIKKLNPCTPLTQQTDRLPYDAQWEFPRNRLKFGE